MFIACVQFSRPLSTCVPREWMRCVCYSQQRVFYYMHYCSCLSLLHVLCSYINKLCDFRNQYVQSEFIYKMYYVRRLMWLLQSLWLNGNSSRWGNTVKRNYLYTCWWTTYTVAAPDAPLIQYWCNSMRDKHSEVRYLLPLHRLSVKQVQ